MLSDRCVVEQNQFELEIHSSEVHLESAAEGVARAVLLSRALRVVLFPKPHCAESC